MNQGAKRATSVADAGLTWVRSSRCAPNQNCVELRITDEVVGVRDSKNIEGSTLSFTHEKWSVFLGSVIL